MQIQVLGSGCATCKKLFEKTKEAVEALQLNVQVEYITGAEGTKQIVELGVMVSPVLTVNGKVAMTGFSPDLKVIQAKIVAGLEEA